MKTLFLIIGRPRHGKDLFGGILAQQTEGKKASTSDLIYTSIAERLVSDRMQDQAASIHAQFTAQPITLDLLKQHVAEPTQAEIDSIAEGLKQIPKETMRPLLIARGNSMVAADPASMVKELYRRGATVITGLRRRAEFEAVKAWASFADVSLVTIWVSRDNFTGPVDNLELTPADADINLVFQSADTEKPQTVAERDLAKLALNEAMFEQSAYIAEASGIAPLFPSTLPDQP